ncbi:MAG: hypothetical protein ACRD2K_03180 [Terriglobales bacterium]
MISLALVLSLCAASGQGREKRVKLKDLPEAVRKTVVEQSNGAKLRALSQETQNGETFYEAELIVEGRSRDVLMDSSGAIVEIEEEVPWNSLPAAVKAGLEQQAGRGKILKVESITKNDQIVAYEAHLQAGGKKSEIKVGPDGKPITLD